MEANQNPALRKNQNLHLGISIPEDFPSAFEEDLQKVIGHPKLEMQIRKTPSTGMFSSLEWAIPTLIGVYILKPYFESFLSEMGKDHYNLLKNWMKKTANETRLISIRTIVSTESPDKLSKPNSQSKVFSVESYLRSDNHKIKFLFDTTLSIEIWEAAIDSMLVLLEEHYKRVPDDIISKTIIGNNLHRDIYAVIDPEAHEWVFYDYRKIIELSFTDSTNL